MGLNFGDLDSLTERDAADAEQLRPKRRRRCKECNAMPGLIWDHYQFCSKADGGTPVPDATKPAEKP